MPDLDMQSNTSGANGSAVDWELHILTFLVYLETFMNTTGLDQGNIQSNGLYTTNMASYKNPQMGRQKLRNESGATLAANTLVYISGMYDDGDDQYPSVTKALVAGSSAATFYAMFILEAEIINDADGYGSMVYEVTGLDTSGKTVGDSLYLNTTAGEYTYTTPVPNNRIQIVGRVTKVDASAGRILFVFPGVIVPYANADQI